MYDGGCRWWRWSVSVDVFYRQTSCSKTVGCEDQKSVQPWTACASFPWWLLCVTVALTVWTLVLSAETPSTSVRREKTTNKQLVSQGKGEVLHLMLSATVATLSWSFSGRRREVVDIVLLLQQQHNNRIFTSFLTRRTWCRVVANFWKFLLLLPFVLSTFSVPAVLCPLHLCKYSLWC